MATGRGLYRLLATSVLMAFIGGSASAVTLTDRMHSTIEKGNRRYEEDKHEEALEFYLRAQDQDSTHAVPRFNAGDALYRLGRFGDGASEFLRSATSAADSISAMSYYNLGNSMFRGGDIRNAVEAYKKSLLMNPDDEDAKYNLEYALRMLEQQSQENQQEEQDEKDRDQEGEQQDREQQSQQQEGQDEQEQPDQPNDESQPPREDQQQQSPREITPEELERILAAIEASDKDTQEEMIKKASRHKRITGKDW